MKVFAVVEEEMNGGITAWGVFSSEEKARTFVESKTGKRCDWFYHVYEFVLDEPQKQVV